MGFLIEDNLTALGTNLLSGYTTISNNLDVDGDVRFDGSLAVNGTFQTGQALKLNGGASWGDTYIDGVPNMYQYVQDGPDPNTNWDYSVNADYDMAGQGTLKVRKGFILSGSTFTGLTTAYNGTSGSSGVDGTGGGGYLSFSGKSTNTNYNSTFSRIQTAITNNDYTTYSYTGTSTGVDYPESCPAGIIDGSDGASGANVTLNSIAYAQLSLVSANGVDMTAFATNGDSVIGKSWNWVFVVSNSSKSTWGAYKTTFNGVDSTRGIFTLTFVSGTTDASSTTFASLGTDLICFFVWAGVESCFIDNRQGGTSAIAPVMVANTTILNISRIDNLGFDVETYLSQNPLQTITIKGSSGDWVIFNLPADRISQGVYWATYITSNDGTKTLDQYGDLQYYWTLNGAAGATGADGTSGVDGTSGSSGVNGTSGSSGSSGISATGNTYADFYYSGSTLYVPNVNIDNNLFVKGTIGGTLGPLGFQNYIFVGDPLSDYPTLAASLTKLATSMTGNTTLVLTADNEIITSPITINLPYNLMITSGGYDQSTITAGLTGDMCDNTLFTLESDVSFSKIIITAVGGATGTTIAIFNQTDDLYIEFKDSSITGFDKGIVSVSNAEFWVFESVINDCYTSGFELNTISTGARYRSSVTDYSASIDYPNYTGINILSGNSIYISSQLDTTELSTTGQTFIKYAGASITYIDFVVQGCSWNNIGIFRSGFDFTLKRDADIILLNNTGDEDMKPHAKYVSILNTSGITLNTTNQAIPWSATTTYGKKISFSQATQAITYLPTHKTSLVMWISGAITASNQPATVTLSVVKNGNFTGTTLGNMSIYIDQNSRAFNFSTNVYLDDVLENDTYVIAGKCSTGTEAVILQDLNWLILNT